MNLNLNLFNVCSASMPWPILTVMSLLAVMS